MQTRENQLQDYYRTIRGVLPCSRKQKNGILEKIRCSVSDYLEEYPDADFDRIQAHFGRPQAIAAAYLDNLETEELLGALQVRRKVASWAAAVAVAGLLIWGTGVTAAVVDSHFASRGTVEYQSIQTLDSLS